jgi:hypothetical protein
MAGLRGARLCYGEPVHVDGRTVIPVAQVRAAGGFRSGAGGGGRVDARPIGFIEVSAHGSRFEPIAQPPGGAARLIAGGAAAAAGLLGAAALRRRRPGLPERLPRRLLPK